MSTRQLAKIQSMSKPAPQRPVAARRKQSDRRAEAEARLLEAARQIVARKGWVGMTLAEVGEAAGYSRGLAAHYFSSKANLLRALAAYIHENFLREIGNDTSGREGLHGVLHFVAAYLGRTDPRWINTRALLVLMAEATTDDSEIGEALALHNQGVLEAVERHFRRGAAIGHLRPGVDTQAAAAIVLGIVRGLMLQKLLRNSSVRIKPTMSELRAMLVLAYARCPQDWPPD